MRHGLVTCYDPKAGVSISTLAWEYAPGFQVDEHGHGADQLIFATHGVMEVASDQSLWLIPPNFAIWIPAGTLHSIRMPGACSMRTLYFRAGLVRRLPKVCSVLHVAPLLRELIVHTVGIGQLSARRPLQRALRDVILSQLEAASPVPVSIRLPLDSRALAVAQALMRGLADRPTLQELARRAAISVRTVERVFRAEVGMDFEAWRRQVRLMRGIELLAAGSSVKEAAFAIGYRQPSAFVTTFRQTMGSTPKAWLSLIAAH
jgi:AraC-like DNA-binding protein/mannose-6-phosphate isomerase-like protein (cupin superfamily)